MRGHQAIPPDIHTVLLAIIQQNVQILFAILILKAHLILAIPAMRDMVRAVGGHYPSKSGISDYLLTALYHIYK